MRNSVATFAAKINRLLADGMSLYLKTKNFHWHVTGPHFRDYHLMLDEQASDILDTIDPLAERVRAAGSTTIRSLGQVARLRTIADNEADDVASDAMLAELMEDNKALAAAMRQAHKLCDALEHVATASLLEGYIDAAEKRAWFLRAAALIVAESVALKVQNRMPQVRSGSVCAGTHARSNPVELWFGRTFAAARARTMRSAHAFRPAAQNGLDADLSDTDLLQGPLGVSTSAAKASAPSREAEFDVNLFVIGGGSGGIRAARVASGHGAKVMLAEEYRLGGTCVIRGCVPKKLFVYASRFNDTFDEAAEFGWRLSVPHFDWPSLVAAKDREITRLEGLYSTGQESAGVEVVTSRAVLEDAHTVRLLEDGRRVRAHTILIATGARPELPPFDGIELGITSDAVFDLKTFPRKLVIGGAGYIAMEFAGLFAALGSDVTVVCRGSNVLRGFDEDVRQAVAASYTNRGIKLMLSDSIRRLERRDGHVGGGVCAGGIDVTTEQGGRLVADQVLLAFGRTPGMKSITLRHFRSGESAGSFARTASTSDSSTPRALPLRAVSLKIRR